jgi:hypothetical protein
MAKEVSFNDFEDGGWTRNPRTGRGAGWRADDDWDTGWDEEEEEEEEDSTLDEEDDWEDWEDLDDSSEEIR